MRRQQLGIGMGGLMVGGVIFIVVAMLGMKLAPSYLEFFAIKKVINAVAAEARGGASVAQVRKSFDNRATVDDISTVKGADLEVTKDASGVTVSVSYRKEIPLAANIGVYIQFNAGSKD